MNERTARFNDHATPLVTIVVNHREGRKQLDECLRAIVGQSYPNLEVVLYDFGTQDDSWDCAVAYQQDYAGIITLLRARFDFVFDSVPHFPNIRGRYFIAIESTTLLKEGAVALAVAALRGRNGCAFVLLNSERQQETERFYSYSCEVSGIDQLRSHLLSVPYPDSTIALYDTDIAKVHNRYEPYTNQANLCLIYSVVSICEPLFSSCETGDSNILFPHFLSLCQQKAKLLELVERLHNLENIEQLKSLVWERFGLELLLLAKGAVLKQDFITALRYFSLAQTQFPELVDRPWYAEAHESLVLRRTSSFWGEGVDTLYRLEPFVQTPDSMVAIDEA